MLGPEVLPVLQHPAAGLVVQVAVDQPADLVRPLDLLVPVWDNLERQFFSGTSTGTGVPRICSIVGMFSPPSLCHDRLNQVGE